MGRIVLQPNDENCDTTAQAGLAPPDPADVDDDTGASNFPANAARDVILTCVTTSSAGSVTSGGPGVFDIITATVSLLISTDGGGTWPTTLVTNVLSANQNGTDNTGNNGHWSGPQSVNLGAVADLSQIHVRAHFDLSTGGLGGSYNGCRASVTDWEISYATASFVAEA